MNAVVMHHVVSVDGFVADLFDITDGREGWPAAS